MGKIIGFIILSLFTISLYIFTVYITNWKVAPIVWGISLILTTAIVVSVYLIV
jgi:hypothetical protein